MRSLTSGNPLGGGFYEKPSDRVTPEEIREDMDDSEDREQPFTKFTIQRVEGLEKLSLEFDEARKYFR